MNLSKIAARESMRAVILAILACQLAPPAVAQNDADCPAANSDCGTHNMMLVGQEAAFISHLPMFGNQHRYQFIARVSFAEGGVDLTPLYAADRQANSAIRMYTVHPTDSFVLSRLFSPEGGAERATFMGDVFRGHLERRGTTIDALQNISVQIEEVVYAKELGGAGNATPELSYVVFGDGDDRYLAHVIAPRPDDFDQIVGASIKGDLPDGTLVNVTGRQNVPDDRLRPDESVIVEVAGGGGSLQLVVAAEYYFEEGELLLNDTMGPTEREIEAGFGN